LIASRAGLYSRSIRLAGAPLENCIGFIDGTFIQIGRPKGASQHANYSGHKRINCIKFQAVAGPDGMVLNRFGPVEGRRHDMYLFMHSGIEDDLQRALVVGGRQYYIYGDSAYVIRPFIFKWGIMEQI
jgi:nuclease HARBI1